MDLCLRPVVAADLPVLYDHQCDPLARSMAAFEGRNWPDFHEHWTTRVLHRTDLRCVCIVADGRVSGHVCRFHGRGGRHVGYWVARDIWGQGVATWALRTFLQNEAPGTHRAEVFEANRASMRVLEHAGFRDTGEIVTDPRTHRFRVFTRTADRSSAERAGAS